MNHLHEFLIFSDSKQNRSVLHLEDSLTAFSQITKIPVSYFDTEGRYCWSTLPEERLCNANLEYEKKGTPCTRNLLASMNISLSLPDAYIFMCEAGLIHPQRNRLPVDAVSKLRHRRHFLFPRR